MPKSFKEAPALANWSRLASCRLSSSGSAPSQSWFKPVHEIGKYGGTWRRGFTGPADYWNGFRSATGPDHILFWDYTGDKIVPNIAKASTSRTAARRSSSSFARA